MRKLICDKSYMDEVLPSEMNINFENKNYEDIIEKIFQLESYYIKYKWTEKWHKGEKNQTIRIISSVEKMNLSKDELLCYYNNLKYFYEKTITNYSNRKIIRLSKKKEESLSDEEYRIYLKELRLYDDEKDSQDSFETRRRRAPYLRALMKLSGIFYGIKVYHLNTAIPKNSGKRPIIFAFTHVGRNDQIVFSNYVKEHYLVLSGDYESMHNCIEGRVTRKNGVLFFDMNSTNERGNVSERVASKLSEGYNILCSMEAAWNLYSNIPVQELFRGMFNAALLSNALILPVAVEMFNQKLFGINIAECFFDPLSYDISQFTSSEEMLKKITNDLRNNLSDLKMQLYFHKKINKRIRDKRENIGDYDTYNQSFKRDILKGWTFSESDIERKRYHGKEQPIYVFKYLLQKYDMIFSLCEKIKDDKMDVYDRVTNLKRVRILLLELLDDIGNPIYPNDIHNQLKDVYFQVSSYLDDNKDICSDFKELRRIIK